MRTALQAAFGFLCVAVVFHAGALLSLGALTVVPIGAGVAAAIALVVVVARAEW